MERKFVKLDKVMILASRFGTTYKMFLPMNDDKERENNVRRNDCSQRLNDPNLFGWPKKIEAPKSVQGNDT